MFNGEFRILVFETYLYQRGTMSAAVPLWFPHEINTINVVRTRDRDLSDMF